MTNKKAKRCESPPLKTKQNKNIMERPRICYWKASNCLPKRFSAIKFTLFRIPGADLVPTISIAFNGFKDASYRVSSRSRIQLTLIIFNTMNSLSAVNKPFNYCDVSTLGPGFTLCRYYHQGRVSVEQQKITLV